MPYIKGVLMTSVAIAELGADELTAKTARFSRRVCCELRYAVGTPPLSRLTRALTCSSIPGVASCHLRGRCLGAVSSLSPTLTTHSMQGKPFQTYARLHYGSYVQKPS